MLKIAFLALEDGEAFEEQSGKKMTSADHDDNWAAWVMNALDDGATAYSLDRGQISQSENIQGVNSCVAGVDHRIIHGLTGLHPDVKIAAGSTEQSNLVTWSKAQSRFKEQKKAVFYNSVFKNLMQEWANQRTLPTPETPNESRVADQMADQIASQFNPLATAAYLKDYQNFVTQRAQSLFGDEILNTDELKTILETIENYPERLMDELRTASISNHS